MRVELPEPPVTEAGAKLALAPVGSPLALRLTVPVKPPLGVIVEVYVVALPACTVCDAGVALTAKSPTTGALTTSETEAVCVSVPSVPVIVSGYVPAATAVVVVMAKVELPEVVTVPGVNVPVAPAGNPETLKVTVPVYPPEGVTVAV